MSIIDIGGDNVRQASISHLGELTLYLVSTEELQLNIFFVHIDTYRSE